MSEDTLEAWIETSAEALVAEFERRMTERNGSFSERESIALALSNAVTRRWMKAELARMAGAYGDEILVGGQRYRRHTSGQLRYHSLCGPVEVSRDTYRVIGVHNGPTVVPLELEAGILENATPALAMSVVQAFATMPLRHYEDEMRAAHRRVPSRSTLERIAKRVAANVHEELPTIEPLLRNEETIPPHATSISVGVDRTTIPMAEQLPALPDYWHRKRARRPPPPIIVAYRMAYIATVAINDERGRTITSKRIAATADEGPNEMMERLGAELRHILQQRPMLPVVVVQDGAPELWNLVEEWFSNFDIAVEMKLIDRYHLDERLAEVAEIVERDERARRKLLDEWRAALDRGDGAIKRICKQIENRIYEPIEQPKPKPKHGRDRSHSFGQRDWEADWRPSRSLRVSAFNARIVERHLGYCDNYADKMRYARARKRGFPIGSGVTEGACKSVIAARMKRSGQRWFETGASACLQLRTLHLNGRLERGIQAHVRFRREALQVGR